MHVLDLTTLYLDGGGGGVNTYLREKARYVARLNAERSALGTETLRHTAVVTGASSRTESMDSTRVHYVRSPSLPGNPEHRVLVHFGKLRKILRAEEPDLVEVDCSYFLGRVARQALGRESTPIVGLYHVHLPRLYTREVRNPLRRGFTRSTESLAWKYSEFCARPCDHVVATSREITHRLRQADFPPVSCIPLGVNLDLFDASVQSTEEDGDRRVRLPGVDASRPVILFVGRLSPEKDIDVLLDAHRRLRVSHRAQLLFAGDGPLRRRLEKIARTASDVFCLGPTIYGEELARVYRSVDVLAAPGRYEAFGLVVLEALASGLPVVAAASGGPAETLHADLGRLARPGDSDDFAAKIGEALAMSGQGSAARRLHVEKHYSWDNTFRSLFDLYENLIRTRSGALGASSRPCNSDTEVRQLA